MKNHMLKYFAIAFLFFGSFRSYCSDQLLLVVSYFANNKGVKRKAGGAGHIHMTIYRMIRGSIVEGFKADIWDDSLKTDLHSLFASDQTASNKKGKKFFGDYNEIKAEWIYWSKMMKPRRSLLLYNCATCSVGFFAFLTKKPLNTAVLLPKHAFEIISGALGQNKLESRAIEQYTS